MSGHPGLSFELGLAVKSRWLAYIEYSPLRTEQTQWVGARANVGGAMRPGKTIYIASNLSPTLSRLE